MCFVFIQKVVFSFESDLHLYQQLILVGNVGKKSHLTCSLNSNGELSLVKSAVAAYTSGEDLCSLRDELSELSNVLVIDLGNLVLAEDANLLSSVVRTEATALRFVSFHLGNYLSDSRFLYCSHRSEPSGTRTSLLTLN